MHCRRATFRRHERQCWVIYFSSQNKFTMNRYFEEDKAATAEICGQPEPDQVILAWASRKRHIFVNGTLLCEKVHKSAGYSPRGRHYISYQLDMPKSPKATPDEKYCHSDGIIPAMPLDEIKIGNGGISRKSICVTCQKRYDKIFMPTSFCR